MFVNGSGRNEQSLQRTFHRCFLPSFGSFGQAVSKEKILKNRPIRNKNCLWRPCLLMNRDKMSKLYRGPSIDASYQVSVHLAKRFQRRRLQCEKLADGRRRTDLDINVCPIPVKTDVGQVDLVLRLSDGTSEKIRLAFPNVPVRRTNLFPLV